MRNSYKSFPALLIACMSIITVVPFTMYGQYENVWAFGNKAGIAFTNGAPVSIQTGIVSNESSASVCDRDGRLLFYTDGNKVWDRNDNMMPNGFDLVPGSLGQAVTSSTSQGAVIVPVPDDANKYFLFSLTSVEYWGPGRAHLYYSVVDMSLNGGMGDVVSSQKGMLVDSFLSEKMTTVVGSRCNVWLVTASLTSMFSAVFQSYEINASGLNTTPVVSAVGLGSVLYPAGVLAAAPDGKKIIATQCSDYGGYNGAALFDFDPSTGVVTNPLQLLPVNGAYGACFSPDNTKVYVNETVSGNIYQFNLSAGTPTAVVNSKTPLGAVGFTQLKPGPDGKIYFRSFTPGNFGNYLGVIAAPGLAGAASQFTPNVVALQAGTEMRLGLPNVISVIRHDTVIHTGIRAEPCFANVHPLMLHATNDSSGWDYLWNTGDSGPQLIPDTPGTYWLHYYAPPCVFHADTFHVIFPNGVLPDIYTDTACVNAANGRAYAATYAGDPVSYHYTWRNISGDTLSLSDTLAGVPSGQYILQVRTDFCDTSLSFIIPEAGYQVAFGGDSLLCMGDSVLFTNLSAAHFTRFRWDFGDGDSSLLMQPSFHFYPHAGSYTVRLAGSGSVCTDTASETIIVDSLLAGVFLTDRDSTCTGASVTFLPQTGSTAMSLHWQWGDGTEMSGPNEAGVPHAFDRPGAKPVTLFSRFRACPDTSFTDTVYVYSFPRVDLGPDTGLCYGGAPLWLFNRDGPAFPGYHYLWNTGDTAERLKVVHPGTYSLTIAADPLGCSTTETITVSKDCYMDIPNAFTPNGDGDNDYFFPRQRLHLKTFRMQIFNRWGQLVFETARADGAGWDGTFNGAGQPQGVYIYLIDATLENGKAEHYRGNVTLLR